jgi:hypothetical protein
VDETLTPASCGELPLEADFIAEENRRKKTHDIYLGL